MPKTKSKNVVDKAGSQRTTSAYLAQCRVKALSESATVQVPPTSDEVSGLISWLKSKGLKPLIVGSVGVLSYLSVDPSFGFRPTVDVDIWLDKMPNELPSGWKIDRESVGVPSWVSQSGGHVDFLLPNQDLPSGRTPARIEPNPDTLDTDFPVASWQSLLKLKLNSYREKDLADSIALVRAVGRVPSAKELKGLNATQADNLRMVKLWLELRPSGKYGE